MGAVLNCQKKFQEALRPLQQSELLMPTAWQVYFESSKALLQLGKFQPAMQQINKAFALRDSVLTARPWANFSSISATPPTGLTPRKRVPCWIRFGRWPPALPPRRGNRRRRWLPAASPGELRAASAETGTWLSPAPGPSGSRPNGRAKT